MKKLLGLLLLCGCIALTACHNKKSPYNRTDAKQDYEYFIRNHVFAACLNEEQPYALYSMADLRERPSNNDPRYKVTFINGPCKGKTIWTTHVILKTEPAEGGLLPTGTILLRNYHNPKEPFDKEKTDRWHVGIVSDNSRVDKGIVDLVFPRDSNDFLPARESVYLHNTRFVIMPEVKDVRTFIH